MEAKTVILEPMKVLSVKHRGSYFKIGTSFEKLSAFVKEQNIEVSDARWLGVYFDDPESVPEEELRSEACVTIKEDIELPEDSDISIGEINGGLYATTRHSGSYKGLGEAWGELYGAWMPQNGFNPGNTPCFEIYVKGCEEVEDESEYLTDLYAPVEPV
jgi:AraC family transcriptional regulator